MAQRTLTTYDEKLCKILEPNVSTTRERFEALKVLRDNGIPTVVWLCPILPFINDTAENLKGILDYCVEAKVQGILCFDMGVTLREGDREYFYAALERHFPGLKQQYVQRFGNAYACTSDNKDVLMKLFTETCKSHGIMHKVPEIFSYLKAFPKNNVAEQLCLFE